MADALALIPGAGQRCEVTLGIALSAVRFWEGVFEQAAGDLAIAATTPDRTEARRRFDIANLRLEAALNRRDRLACETQGRRWLWLAGPADEVSFG